MHKIELKHQTQNLILISIIFFSIAMVQLSCVSHILVTYKELIIFGKIFLIISQIATILKTQKIIIDISQ